MPYRVAIIGAGFGGIGMAIALEQAGIEDFVVVDRADDLGGTWRDNSYPGFTCDIPSQLYSFSFRPWRWSRRFPGARRDPRLPARAGRRARSRPAPALRPRGRGGRVRRAARGLGPHPLRCTTLQAGAVICAVGQLGYPVLPDIPGQDEFAGPWWHSARWNHQVDLAGRRVAVIGTGASAIQFVPEIAKVAGHVDVYQRTAPYVLPKADRPYRDAELAMFDRLPAVRKADRLRIFLYGELLTSGFVLSPKLLAGPMALWRRQLRTQIADPELRAKCVPDYVMGCKRVVFSNDWYPALARPDVNLVTDRIERIVPEGVVTVDGTTRPADVIIYGTGFQATQFLTPCGYPAAAASGWTRPGRTGRRPTWASRSPGSRTSSCSTGRTPTSAATRSSTCSKARSATCSALSGRWRSTTWPGWTYAPTSRTRSTPGSSRPAGNRSGKAAVTAGTPRPPGATPTTGPTTRSYTGTGSAASTWPHTGSCRTTRPRPMPLARARPLATP